MKIINYAVCLILATTLGFACSSKDNDDPQPPSGTTPGPKFLAVKEVVTNSCALAGCHVSPDNAGGYNFQSNANIVLHGGHIKEQAVDLKTMPPTGPLPESEQAKISAWIAAGGKLTD